jgi:citrate/tricarballylate utilization protein
MPSSEPIGGDTLRDARREMEICNACRYCEGFCAVFPAMMRRREFTDGDLNYFANLCHNCKGCYHACQYAPPHPFGVNVPRTLAALRLETYERYAWPRPLAALYRRNGVVLSAVTILAVALVLGLVFALRPGQVTTTWTGEGAFYAVIPWAVMAGTAGAAMTWALVALAVGGVRFWRDTGGGQVTKGGAVAQAVHDALTLRYLGGGHEGADGCNDVDEAFSQGRRRFHHALFYGFALCFASTSVAFLYDHFLNWPAPYPLFSLPVILGTLGGLGMMVGSAGLLWLKVVSDPAANARKVLGADYALLALLFGAAATGLLLLALRSTPAMGTLLAVHLGVILSLFVLLPYSKMVHGLYRSLALLRHHLEGRGVKPAQQEALREPRFAVTRNGRSK